MLALAAHGFQWRIALRPKPELRRKNRRRRWLLPDIPADHLQQYSDLALTWMQEYLRIDTTNPPGHEMRAVSFYKKILDEEGIENRAFEYTPGRGDLWARLPHTTAEAQAANHPAEPHGCGHQRSRRIGKSRRSAARSKMAGCGAAARRI